MKMKRDVEIESMLLRYYEGVLSDEENAFVEQWINTSESNRTIAHAVQLLYLASDTSKVLKTIDTKSALNRVNRRINRNRGRSLFVCLVRAAVILLLPFISISFWRTHERMNKPIEMVSVTSNPRSVTVITLPDGTVVHLNSESELTYPVRFADDFREVHLDGEAFFDVTKNKDTPFVVNLKESSKIEVFGTKFNIKAFKEKDNIITTLVEGKIRFGFLKNNREKYLEMIPNQKLTFNTKDKSYRVARSDGLIETCWKDDRVIFNNTKLETALDILSERFGVDFIVKDTELNQVPFTGNFHKSSLEQILECFRLTTNFKWKYVEQPVDGFDKAIIEIYQ